MRTKFKEVLIKVLFYFGVFRGLAKLISYIQVPTATEQNRGLGLFHLKMRKNQSIQVLAYHRVSDQKDCYFSPISTQYFDRQMEFLSEKFEVISAAESVERLARNEVPPHCVVVTLDDGYRDNYTYAFPILKKYGIPATIYLATGCMNEKDILWHDQICSAFNKTSTATLNLQDFNGETYNLANPIEKNSALYAVLWSLREVQNEERIVWKTVVRERLGFLEDRENSHGERLMLNVAELQKLRDGGISLGAHTVTHPILSQTSLVHAKQEIHCSKSEIETQLHVQVETFAYPSGRRVDFNEEVKRLVKEEGFVGAFSMINGVNEFGADPFELRRIPVGDWDIPYFSKELLLAKI